MPINNISSSVKMSIFTTNIPDAIKNGDLKNGNFDIAGNGDIVPITNKDDVVIVEWVKKRMFHLLGRSKRDPKKLGELFAKLNETSQQNPNEDYAVDHGFAVINENTGVNLKIRKQTQQLQDDGWLT